MAGQQSLENIYPYHVTEFINVGRRPKIKKVDIVATKWMHYDMKKKKCVAKYPPPPYDKDSYEAYNQILRNLEDPLDNWLTYSVKIRGKAKTLEEAYAKLDYLNKNDTSLTMDSGESCTEVEKRAVESIRKNKLQNIATTYKNAISQKSSSMNQDILNSKPFDCQERNSVSQGTNVSSKSTSMVQKASGNKSLDCQETSLRAMHLLPPLTRMSSRSMAMIQKPSASESLDCQETSLSDPSPEDITSIDALAENFQVESNKKGDEQLLLNDNISNANAGSYTNVRAKSGSGATNNQTSELHQRSPYQQFVTECLINLLSDVKEMKNDLKKMKLDLENLKSNQIQETNSISNLKQLCEKYGYNIPFQSVDAFTAFDQDLSTNKSLREDVCAILRTCNDSTFVISRSIVNMLKMFLEKDVASKYVAVKKVKNKHIMTKTNFYNCIEVTIKDRRNLSNLVTCDKELISALSNVLSNSVSWYGSKKSDDPLNILDTNNINNGMLVPLGTPEINQQLSVRANHTPSTHCSTVLEGNEEELDLPIIVIEQESINEDIQRPQRDPILTGSKEKEFIPFEEYLSLHSQRYFEDDDDSSLDNNDY